MLCKVACLGEACSEPLQGAIPRFSEDTETTREPQCGCHKSRALWTQTQLFLDTAVPCLSAGTLEGDPDKHRGHPASARSGPAHPSHVRGCINVTFPPDGKRGETISEKTGPLYWVRRKLLELHSGKGTSWQGYRHFKALQAV